MPANLLVFSWAGIIFIFFYLDPFFLEARPDNNLPWTRGLSNFWPPENVVHAYFLSEICHLCILHLND